MRRERERDTQAVNLYFITSNALPRRQCGDIHTHTHPHNSATLTLGVRCADDAVAVVHHTAIGVVVEHLLQPQRVAEVEARVVCWNSDVGQRLHRLPRCFPTHPTRRFHTVRYLGPSSDFRVRQCAIAGRDLRQLTQWRVVDCPVQLTIPPSKLLHHVVEVNPICPHIVGGRVSARQIRYQVIQLGARGVLRIPMSKLISDFDTDICVCVCVCV